MLPPGSASSWRDDPAHPAGTWPPSPGLGLLLKTLNLSRLGWGRGMLRHGRVCKTFRRSTGKQPFRAGVGLMPMGHPQQQRCSEIIPD